MNESESSDPNFFALVCNKTIIAHLKKKKLDKIGQSVSPIVVKGIVIIMHNILISFYQVGASFYLILFYN